MRCRRNHLAVFIHFIDVFPIIPADIFEDVVCCAPFLDSFIGNFTCVKRENTRLSTVVFVVVLAAVPVGKWAGPSVHIGSVTIAAVCLRFDFELIVVVTVDFAAYGKDAFPVVVAAVVVARIAVGLDLVWHVQICADRKICVIVYISCQFKLLVSAVRGCILIGEHPVQADVDVVVVLPDNSTADSQVPAYKNFA